MPTAISLRFFSVDFRRQRILHAVTMVARSSRHRFYGFPVSGKNANSFYKQESIIIIFCLFFVISPSSLVHGEVSTAVRLSENCSELEKTWVTAQKNRNSRFCVKTENVLNVLKRRCVCVCVCAVSSALKLLKYRWWIIQNKLSEVSPFSIFLLHYANIFVRSPFKNIKVSKRIYLGMHLFYWRGRWHSAKVSKCPLLWPLSEIVTSFRNVDE